MAVTSNTFTGDGSTTNYSFTFEYLEQDEVKVTLGGELTTAFTFANATTLSFTTAPTSGVEIRIYRDTNIDDLKATFFPGSAIKAEDLNNNFTQNNFVVQEIQNNTWDRESETIHSDETWVSSDGQLATTAAIDARFQDEVGDTIESTETWVSDDDHIPTTAAADDQYTTLVQLTTPSGSDYPVGKTWLQNDEDLTLSIWNGSGWIGIASGGTFTNLPKVVYVDSVNGNDINEGHRISGPKKTIKAAIEQINGDDTYGDGSVVLLAPGIYGEQFPIDIQKNDVSIIGTALRNCIIHPAIPEADQASYNVNTPHANELSTMFRVNSGTYISNLTMTGMKASGTRGGNPLDTDTTTGLPTNQGWNVAFLPDAEIRKSPYIQNCTNFSDSKINNVDFTPHVPGQGAAGDLDSDPTGGGILINGATVASNSPLRSMVCDSYTHTALDGPGIFVTNNGYCQATSSYAFFCHYHLKAKNGGQANLAASTSDFGRYSLIADGRSTSAIFTASTVGSAGVNSTTFTIDNLSAGANWHGSATRPQNNMVVDVGGYTYPILSSTASGSGWVVTISRPNPEDLSENLGLQNAVGNNSPVTFYLRSMIASSGHTMEYVGSGTNYSALPENGGVPDDSKQLIEQSSGKIWAAVTDHKGTFKVGDTFSVDQQSGFITFGTGSFAIPTLLVDLNLNGNRIYDSTGDATFNSNIAFTGAQTVDGRDLSVDGAKLDGIEAGATADQTAAEILTAIKTVDGSTSGLDADLLDGQEGSYYRDASNINAGTIGDAYLPATISSDITGNAATATTLATARTIQLSGDVTGSTTFDGSANATITATVADDSHNHVTSNIDNFTEEVQDVVGEMVTGNTESGIAVTYNDTTGKLNFDVSDPTITLSGAVTGSATMTNLGNVTLTATVVDDSHNHVISNIDDLQTTLDGKLPLSGGTMTGNITFNSTQTFDGRDLSVDGTKLDGIAAGAEVNVNADWDATTGDAEILNKPPIELTTTVTHIGADAGLSYASATAVSNTAIGVEALKTNVDGPNNTAVGHKALTASTTTTGNNTAVGTFALTANTSGSANTAVGNRACYSNTYGTGITAVGASSQALLNGATGSTSVGAYSLGGAVGTAAVYNTAVGYGTLYSTNTGTYNAALGYQAGYNVTTGQYNIFIGSESGGGITTGSYNVVIGAISGLSAGLGNTVIVGDGEGNERFRVDSNGNMGINQTGPASRLDVNGAYSSNIDSTVSSTITCSNGNYFTRTISADTTYIFASVPASRSYSFTLELNHTSGTVTWPTSVKWPADTAPTLTTGKTHLFVFITDDAGTTWRGAALTDYTT